MLYTVNKFTALILFSAILALSNCSSKNDSVTVNRKDLDSMQLKIKNLIAENERIIAHLNKFDTLDYKVFTNQQWSRMFESHSKFIRVHWPDGRNTIGIDKHVEDLKDMFIYAPNTSIRQHPIRFGSANMTCVVGVMTGTFTRPMPIGKGKFIQPTGKSFSIQLCTVGIWKDAVMIEEYLFWDNQSFMKQIGI